ncbi:hypothetical protein AQ436_06535 [Arthrobacter sp. EpRS66]|nr:hypothetical protein AQ436_06535 [Arthrobacter sp. EpRS66]
MKFSLELTDLKEAVRFAQTAIAGRPTSPIMGGALLEVADERLTASGSDYSKVARVSVPADVDTEGAALLHASLLAQAVGKLKGKAAVSVHEDAGKLHFTQGRAKFSLPLMPVSEYPKDLAGQLEVVAHVRGEDLARVINAAEVAASKDDTLKVLACVRLELGKELTAMGTDRYRLALSATEYEPTRECDYGLNVHGSWLRTVSKTVAGETALLVGTDETGKPVRFGVQSGNYSTSLPLSIGDYPKIRGLFSNSGKDEHLINRQEFVDALDLMSVMNDQNTPVKIIGKGGTITLESAGAEGESKSEIASDNEADFEIGLNPGLALDILREINTEQISFTPNGPKPIYIKPTEGETDYLLMPVRLPSQ